MICEICGSKNIGIKKYHLKSDIFLCKNCGLYFVKNIKFDSFTVNKNIDIKKRMEGLYTIRKENFKIICRYISKKFSNGAFGLEVGSSYGWFLDEVNKINNIKCDGIEPEDIKIDKNKPYKVTRGFFPKDFNYEKKYDFIVFNDVFEHIPDCKNTIKSCYNLLNYGGLLIINIPVSSGIIFNTSRFLSFLGTNKFLNRMWQFNFHSPHIYYFNEKNLKLLAKNNGFFVDKVIAMKTLSKNGIEERILYDKDIIGVKLISTIAKISMPLINNLFNDTKVFFFKK